MFMGKLTQTILPFIWIYTFFAYVIMPYKAHRKSRALFIREAKKLSENEFRKWYKLTAKFCTSVALFIVDIVIIRLLLLPITLFTSFNNCFNSFLLTIIALSSSSPPPSPDERW